MFKVVTDDLEVSHNETETKDLNIVNINFRIIDFREAHFNRTILNMARVLSNSEDVVMVESIIRVAIGHINISITCTTHRWNSMAHPVVYVEVLIIPPSIVTRENMT